jgi:hypothetical protein
MGNKAVSKAVIQVALVIGLVLAANAIKPLSPGNLALHTLSSARSFSFVLPSAAVEKIEHVSLLAQAYSKSLSDSDKSDTIWIKESVMKSGLLASNNPERLFDDAEIKDVKSSGPAKKSSPAKRSSRRVKHDSRDNQSEVIGYDAEAGDTGERPVALPVVSAFDKVAMVQPMSLPAFRPMPVKARLTPASVMFPLSALPAKLNSCKTIEVREVKLIALIQQSQQSSKLKVDVLATQPAKISLQCREEEKVITEEAGPVVETNSTTTGPEEELFFDQPHASAPVPECTRPR